MNVYFFLRIRHPPRSTLFPYTPLFRSEPRLGARPREARLPARGLPAAEPADPRRVAGQLPLRDAGGRVEWELITARGAWVSSRSGAAAVGIYGAYSVAGHRQGE